MGRPRLVLLLSRDGWARRASESCLSVCGFDVLTASDGSEAIALFGDYRRIEILVADAELAGDIDGLGVAQLARERNPKIEIIYTAEAPHRVPRSRMVPAAVLRKWPGFWPAHVCWTLLRSVC
jgi:CheY-like chemotaxis protein